MKMSVEIVMGAEVVKKFEVELQGSSIADLQTAMAELDAQERYKDAIISFSGEAIVLNFDC